MTDADAVDGEPVAYGAAFERAVRAGRDATDRVLAAPMGHPHVYLSTGCLHGFHDYCATAVRADGGPKKPATCKFCDAVCVCACHRQPAHRATT